MVFIKIFTLLALRHLIYSLQGPARAYDWNALAGVRKCEEGEGDMQSAKEVKVP